MRSYSFSIPRLIAIIVLCVIGYMAYDTVSDAITKVSNTRMTYNIE